MQKLTDQEFRAATGCMHTIAGPVLCAALQKLLANYQQQLEAHSLTVAAAMCHIVQGQTIVLERYTEANTCTTTLDLNIQVKP